MLVDTFMFYNELDILELRLSLLDEYVDRFVIVESELNHVGTAKELFFQRNKKRFEKWIHKIEHVIVTAEESPKEYDPWVREKHQRECILRGLDGVPNDSIVMVSDVDEIPDMTRVSYEKLPHVVTAVHMWMFEYSLKYLFTGEPWFGTVITNCEIFKRIGPNYLRENRWKFPKFNEAGWHLSSFGTPQHVWNKMQTYAHGRDIQRFSETPEMFEAWIESGTHTDGKTPLVPRPSHIPLPGDMELLKRLNLI
jgi:beta-1,4-mannosyl-glycoprotein beta-1,4-N-acetylglucosaminyltransferase